MKYLISLLCTLITYHFSAAQSPLALHIPDMTVDVGQPFELEIRTNDFTDITTFQFSIGWETSVLDFDTIVAYNAVLPLAASNFNFIQTAQGKLGITWFNAEYKTLPANEILFRIRFNALSVDTAAVLFQSDPVEIYAENLSGTIAVTPSNGSVIVQLEVPDAPLNDLCGGAVSIQNLFGQGTSNPQISTFFDNTHATAGGTDPESGHDCFYEEAIGQQNGLDNSMWFRFTGDGMHYRITTVQCNTGADYITEGDAQIAVYKGTCDNLIPVDCNEDIGSGNYAARIANLGAEQLVEYYILIDGCRCVGDNLEDVAKGQFCIQVEQLTSVPTSELQNKIRLSLSPNPAADRADVQFELSESQEVGIKLTDQTGRFVRTVLPSGILQAGSQRIAVGLEGLSSGVYFLVLNGVHGVETIRLTKI